MELMKHQRELLDRLKAQNKSLYGKVLWGGVGSGKSITALSYYCEQDMVGDIYVITTAKKRDSLEWVRDAAKLGISTEADSSLYGRLHVDSWNNIKKYTEISGALFIFDEQRLIGSGAWVKAFYKIAKKNAWMVLSATPGDTWMDYIPVFVANGFYKNITEFKRKHVIYSPFAKFPKIDRFIGTEELERNKRKVLVEMPYISDSDRQYHDVHCTFDHKAFDIVSKKRWNIYEDEPVQNVSELFSCMRRVVYSDPSRLTALRDLMHKHPKLIVFYNFNYELYALRTLAEKEPDFAIAEWNGHRKQEIPRTDRWVYLVQYASGAEGWNCTETDAMAFFSLTYSYKQYEQAQGRIDRLNTPFHALHYYTFLSNSLIDNAVIRSLDRKQTFNERKWAEEYLPDLPAEPPRDL